MQGYDVKRVLPALYAPKPGDWHVVDVPELTFLMVDGHGDPNVAPAYVAAVQALYTLSYAVRAVARAELGRVHTVGPLEGWWSAADPRLFVTGDKGAWDWTMAICQPAWATADLLEPAREQARRKAMPALELVRLESYAEGPSAQLLHVGPYDAEGSALARLHEEFLPRHGLTFGGRHHEVYLSDPRRTAPARLRTVLRQPVVPVRWSGWPRPRGRAG